MYDELCELLNIKFLERMIKPTVSSLGETLCIILLYCQNSHKLKVYITLQRHGCVSFLYLTFDMGLHYFIFVIRNLENKKKLTLVRKMRIL